LLLHLSVSGLDFIAGDLMQPSKSRKRERLLGSRYVLFYARLTDIPRKIKKERFWNFGFILAGVNFQPDVEKQ